MKLPKPRKASVLSETLNRSLNHYAWLAGAAGVSLLALSRSANAEIIFTPANATVEAPGGVYNLDLDNDGNPDFILQGFGDGIVDAFIEIDAAAAGASIQSAKTCVGTLGTYCSYAAALPPGARIPTRRLGGGVIVEDALYYNGKLTYLGFWHNVKNHYLGLRFKINGQIHYGWARMTLVVQGTAMTAHINGYAYETVARQSILAGQRTGATHTPAASSLGALAQGASVRK
jgi:hypothetical protein